MASNEIRDPLYGFIQFSDWEKQIIGHPAFQRLRRIKQLAMTDMVYPGASHTRFEHSLGVMDLATRMYDAITSDDRNKDLLREKLNYDTSGLEIDRPLVRLAALLHDVGHAPFSHASEEAFPIKPGTEKHYKHEDYTVEIIKGPLREVIEGNINSRVTADEVAALIEGNPEVLGPKIFWKEIISSQLDADRADYLLRDSHHIGVKYGVYDVERLLVTITLGVDPEEEDKVIVGVEEGGWHVAEALILARYQMFTQVYFHKTRRAYDYILQEVLKEMFREKGGTFPKPDDIDKYLMVDDTDVWRFIKDNCENEWCKTIKEREHIRSIYEIDLQGVEDAGLLLKKLEKLMSRKIWTYTDLANKSWYNLPKVEQIMIIDKKKSASPLSEYSTIVKNMGEVQTVRIYAKPEDREKAEEIIKEEEK
ncbi:HD domain-containing protein [bacterium]|nr:MAG: HD domain-containing protein [bacterium]